jgi:arylsulfatase
MIENQHERAVGRLGSLALVALCVVACAGGAQTVPSAQGPTPAPSTPGTATAGAAPKPEAAFKGTIKLDVRDSVADWTPYTPKKAPAGAPNILFVLYDDTGLAAWSPYGGRINMLTLDKLAAEGLTYTQWHTTG